MNILCTFYFNTHCDDTYLITCVIFEYHFLLLYYGFYKERIYVYGAHHQSSQKHQYVNMLLFLSKTTFQPHFLFRLLLHFSIAIFTSNSWKELFIQFPIFLLPFSLDTTPTGLSLKNGNFLLSRSLMTSMLLNLIANLHYLSLLHQ